MQNVVRFALLAVAALGAVARAQSPNGNAPTGAETPRAYKAERGQLEYATLVEDWCDEARQRDVPVRIWHPRSDGRFPVIVFSHGLGGTRDGYAFLGQYWAGHGYVSVHVQHKGSDDSVWRDNPRAVGAMQRAATDMDNLLGRPADVSFAIDELTRRNAREGWSLAGRLDLEHLGVAGHSFGAYTALCAAGRDLVGPLGNRVELGDPRVKACVAMSPQGSARERENGSWSDFATPCLHLTGTHDESPIRGDAKPAERRIPFDTITRADQYLLILDQATHMAFSDSGSGLGSRDPAHWPLIQSSSTAFFDAYLKDDAAALAWLRDGEFAAHLGAKGTFEHKSPEPGGKQD